MPMRRSFAAPLLCISLWAVPALADSPNLGKTVSRADVARWDIDISRDGDGLPPGEGTAAQGASIYVEKCAACHGDGGRGAALPHGGLLAPALVSDTRRKGIDGSTTTIANFWPYAPPLFDYIRRAMPWNQPRSLTDHEVYALTAYILAENKLIGGKQVIDARTLSKVVMPNRNGFLVRFPEMTPR